MEGTYITNEKIQKIENEITRTKAKIANYTAKLRKLENDKTAMKNAEFLAIVNGVNIDPDELMAFIQLKREQSGDTPADSEIPTNDKEDDNENI